MKFYKLFFNDFTDVNGNKIEVRKQYDNNFLDCDDIYVYFDLDDLCASFEYEYYHKHNSYLMNFSIYEVNLYDNLRISKNRIYANKMEFLKEVDYNEFINQLDKNARKFNENKLLIEILKLHNDKLLNENMASKDEFILSAIASIGRQQDLDELINDNFPMVCEEVAKHGRNKDFEKLMNKHSYRVFSGMFKSNNNQFRKAVFERRDSDLQDYIYKFNKESLENFFVKENNFGLFSQNEDIMNDIIRNSNNEKIIEIAKQSDKPLIKKLLNKYNR